MFLQKFDGTITLWPKTIASDFWNILADPTRDRLARMLDAGQRCTYGKLKMIENRLKIERAVERGRELTRGKSRSSHEDLTALAANGNGGAGVEEWLGGHGNKVAGIGSDGVMGVSTEDEVWTEEDGDEDEDEDDMDRAGTWSTDGEVDKFVARGETILGA